MPCGDVLAGTGQLNTFHRTSVKILAHVVKVKEKTWNIDLQRNESGAVSEKLLRRSEIGAKHIWAPSSEFVSSSIPSWQTLTAHAQPFRGARELVFCLKVPLDSLLVWASSEGSGETARMRRLAWTFAARIGDKYQIRLTRSKYFCFFLSIFAICSYALTLPPMFAHFQNSGSEHYLTWNHQSYSWAGLWENVSYVICEQHRCRSACASAQSDQSLCCLLLR